MVDTYKETYQVEITREKHSDRVESIAYFDNNRLLHRTGDEPAIVEYHVASGKPVCKTFARHGKEHRSGGKPSCQLIDPVSGVVYFERWMEHGSPNKNGPHSIERDRTTGVATSIHRFENGNEIIEDFDSSGNLDTPHPSP